MSNIDKLLEVMAALRHPDTGCPWDLEQNFGTIAPYTVEEAYEVADAIARDDMPELCDELGDLLLQVVFHARMAEEAGHFDFDTVAGGIAAKMVRRHPHVFGDEAERARGMQTGGWETIKAGERRRKDADPSALAGVAKALPALKRAQKLGKRAAHAGFDWSDHTAVRAKVDEELDELDAAVVAGGRAAIEEEFGDLLFAAVNLARHLDIDAEHALSVANAKFEHRFRDMERAIMASGSSVDAHTPASLEHEWRAAKRRTGS